MELKLKPIAAVIAIGCAINFTAPGRAFAAWCSADAANVYANLLGRFIPFVISGITGVGASAEQAVVQSGAAVRGEVLKGVVAEIRTAEAIEAYEQEQQAKRDAMDLSESLRPPAQSCLAVATSNSMSGALATYQASAFQSSRTGSPNQSPATNVSTVRAMDAAYASTNEKFCSDADKDTLNCRPASGAYAGLGGADRNAAFLFQAQDGSLSYSGNGQAQDEAAAAFVERVTGGIPPQALTPASKEYYASSPQARKYVEDARRYNAMLSMSRYSLNSIRASSQVQQGLGTAMMLATVPVPGFAPNKADMSISEAIDRFVATKFSPANIQDLQTAPKATTILRDMNQAAAFQLWMSFQAQQRSLRTESLMAHQLALINDQVLKPQLDEQRRIAAISRAGSK